MKITADSLNGRCKCGIEHSVRVNDIYIEGGATKILCQMLKDGSIAFTGPAVICDENTAKAAQDFINSVEDICSIVCLKADGLHADNNSVAEAEAKIPEECGLIIAVGSGSIHDISRYIANSRKIPFISVPTAASVDGFVSTVAAMTWNGMKKTFPAVSPIYVFADTDIFSKAPYRLTASGLSDLLGKYTALADWEASSLVTGEYMCQRIVDMEREALAEAVREIRGIRAGSAEGCEKLMYALIISGLAMQLIGNSRPASGAEHHISHLIEMEILNGHIDALHGEKVSIGLVLCLRYYHRIAAEIKNGSIDVRPYDESMMACAIKAFEKKGLQKGLLEENADEPLRKVDVDKLKSNLGDLAKIIDDLPSEEEIIDILEKGGCKKSLEDIGLNSSYESSLMEISPFARNRLTINRLSKLFLKIQP